MHMAYVLVAFKLQIQHKKIDTKYYYNYNRVDDVVDDTNNRKTKTQINKEITITMIINDSKKIRVYLFIIYTGSFCKLN